MSSKKEKRIRKKFKNYQKETIKRALEDLRKYSLKERLKFCFWILKGDKKWKSQSLR